MHFTAHGDRVLRVAEELAESADRQVTLADVLKALSTDPRGSVSQTALAEGIGPSLVYICEKADGLIDMELLRARANEKAVCLGHNYPGPEHILLALVDEPYKTHLDAWARKHGSSAQTIEKLVYEILGHEWPPQQSRAIGVPKSQS